MAKSYEAFREKLEAEHKWPALYMYKFIVPKENEENFYSLFPNKKWNWEVKQSKNGTYISFTKKVMIHSTDEIIETYKLAHSVEGIIAL